MKILIVSSLYPPYMIGGAEQSAWRLAEWLSVNGADVAVVRATDQDEAPGTSVSENGVRIYSVRTAHLYPVFRFPNAPSWQKPLWHLQDHFSSGANAAIGQILDEFRPDIVQIHMLQGIGYPILRELASRKLPVNYVLHDLGLACIRMNMFKKGENCENLCAACKYSSNYKQGLVRDIGNISFISPSQANIDTLNKYFPVKTYPNINLLNPNIYPPATVERQSSATIRLLYAGRIHPSKGVDMLLEAVRPLAATFDISLTIAGAGPQEAELRSQFENAPWCRFLGFISQEQLSNEMANSDLLCIPSVWAENSPGVVVHALSVGLPVLGSAKGGIVELVRDGFNGALVNDLTVTGWREAIRQLLEQPETLAAWHANAVATADDFGQDALGAKVLAWLTLAASGTRDDLNALAATMRTEARGA